MPSASATMATAIGTRFCSTAPRSSTSRLDDACCAADRVQTAAATTNGSQASFFMTRQDTVKPPGNAQADGGGEITSSLGTLHTWPHEMQRIHHRIDGSDEENGISTTMGPQHFGQSVCGCGGGVRDGKCSTGSQLFGKIRDFRFSGEDE